MKITSFGKVVYRVLLQGLELLAIGLLSLAIATVVYSGTVLIFLSLWYHDLTYLYVAIPCAIIGRVVSIYINKYRKKPESKYGL